MTTTDKPSIAELMQAHAIATDERADEDDWGRARDQVLDATPVLLEIAAAALEMERHTVGTVKRREAAERYYAALAKVRP